jgi:hypothetical protein
VTCFEGASPSSTALTQCHHTWVPQPRVSSIPVSLNPFPPGDQLIPGPSPGTPRRVLPASSAAQPQTPLGTWETHHGCLQRSPPSPSATPSRTRQARPPVQKCKRDPCRHCSWSCQHRSTTAAAAPFNQPLLRPAAPRAVLGLRQAKAQVPGHRQRWVGPKPGQEAGQRGGQEAPGNDGLLGWLATLMRPECGGTILPLAVPHTLAHEPSGVSTWLARCQESSGHKLLNLCKPRLEV